MIRLRIIRSFSVNINTNLFEKENPLAPQRGFTAKKQPRITSAYQNWRGVPECNTVGQRRKETYYELLSWWQTPWTRLLWGFSSIFWFPVLCKYEPWVEGEGDVMVTWRNVACLVVSLRWEKKCSAVEMVLVSLDVTRLSWITSKREDNRWRWSVNHCACVCVVVFFSDQFNYVNCETVNPI